MHARSCREVHPPRNGRHPHSRCNWPKLVARGPCSVNAIIIHLSLLPLFASCLVPANDANVVYHNVLSSCTAQTLPVPPHLRSQPGRRSELEQSWLPCPGQPSISRETLVESSIILALRTSLTGPFTWPISS